MDGGEAISALGEDSRSILRFRVAAIEVALFAANVEEVTEPAEITPIPCAPPHVPGIVALRGEALPLFDLGLFLGLSAARASEEPRLLVVRSTAYRVGILCEQVRGVVAVPASRLREARVARPPSLRRYAVGEIEVAEGVTPVLDLDALLSAGRAQ